jgi:hypothetical protein
LPWPIAYGASQSIKTEQSVVEENRAEIDIEDESESELSERVNEILLNKMVEYEVELVTE